MGEIAPNCTRGGTCSEISNSAGIFPARARRAAGYETTFADVPSQSLITVTNAFPRESRTVWLQD
jgi:hypothetical protein